MKKKFIRIAVMVIFLGLLPINHYINASRNTNTNQNSSKDNEEVKELNKTENTNEEDTAVVSAKKTVYVTVTAYSSTPDQTDSTPFITANGTRVRDGIIAANFLPFGTKVRFPDYSGDKIYIVTDRMHKRFPNRADIWFETRQQAVNFGIRKLKLEVL